MTGQGAALAALQQALAAEQAASFGYGVIGAHLSGAAQAAAYTDWNAHQEARDRLMTMISARGGEPVPSAVGYQLPAPVHTSAQALALAVLIEDRVTQAYLVLVALTELDLRRYGALQARDAALRAEAWRGSTLAFPGLPPASLRR